MFYRNTHLDISVSNDNLLLEGFNNIIRKDRNCFGGGIIYLSNNIRAIRRTDFEPACLECIWIERDNHTCSYLLCCIYRHPSSDNTLWTKFSWSLDKVSEYSDKIIIVGDLNVDFFKVPLTHNIREIISTYDLVNNKIVATRNRALLDPILTSTDIQY